MKFTQNKKKKLLIIEIAVIAILAIIAIAVFSKNRNDMPDSENLADESEIVESVTDDNGEQFAPEETQGIPIETKYITLFLPEELEKEISVEQNKKGGVHTVSFSTDIAEKHFELFSILMSKEEQDGYKLGVIRDDKAGDIIVTMVMNEQKAEDWEEKEFEKINGLQERVNDIIIQFYEDSRFVPDK